MLNSINHQLTLGVVNNAALSSWQGRPIGHLASSDPSLVAVAATPLSVGVDVMVLSDCRKLFVVWNRGYNQQMIIAQDPQEALLLSMESGHFMRPSNYRRFLDCTDDYLANKDMAGLQAALDAGRSGVAQLIDGIWYIGGKPATD